MLLFLDIDGVMVPAKSWSRPELLSDGFAAFSNKAVAALQPLISKNTTLLLTTSHKSSFSIEEWKDIFKRRGLDVENINLLANSTDKLDRKDEIENWFHTNHINDDFLIIDDDKSLNSLPAYLKSHLILTMPMVGLTKELLENVGNI